MRKISDFIVNHCYVIFGVFLILVAICGFLATKVTINKDIYSYMPADSETTLGLNIMNDEFNYDATSSYEMMLTDVPANEKAQIKEHIESIEGVKSVDYDDSDTYNRDKYTRYKINVNAPADSELANQVYDTIHDEYEDKYEIEEAGQVYNFNGEVLKLHVTILAVACAMVILLLMSKSWVEPWLFLFAILLAVVANKGTNIIFPSVSHITDAISAILQMALSMDYAIMLSTRYRQEKAKPDHPDKKTAMRRAMRYSFGAISSSSVTTVVGLIVLVFMSFTIGRDMGLVLSKGVILSLVSIFTSLPALLLLFDKAIEKTKKKTLNFKMDWFGKRSYNLRKIAMPLFLFVFVGSIILKGSTGINFTAEQNNRIKDVFNETNQMALVYDAKMDNKVTEACKKFDKREDTTRVLCYGNTINEPEKYNELVAKINSLSSEKFETEDYLVKAIYYHYYKDVDAHEIALDDLVTFLQKEVFPNKNFADAVPKDTVAKVDRFSNFTNQVKVNQSRTKQDIANILGVDGKKLDDVYVLYLSEQNVPTKLTLYEFAQFVTNDILSNSKYASMVTPAQRADLAKLKTFSNKNITDSPKTVAELSSIFGINQKTLEQLLTYYSYTTTSTPTATASIEELINFALSNQNVINEMGLSADEVAQLKTQFATVKTRVSELKNAPALFDQAVAKLPAETQEALAPEIAKVRAELVAKTNEAEQILTKKYSYSDIATAAEKLNVALDKTNNWLNNLESNYPELFDSLSEEDKKTILDLAQKINEKIISVRQKVDLNDKLAKLKNIYKLYQAETTSSAIRLSPRELVNFLLKHQNDAKLKNALSSGTIKQLSLVQYIMNNQNTKYSAGSLAQTFTLDSVKIKLVYALYNYRYENKNIRISLKTLINFIDEKVLPNPDYANRLGKNEQTQLHTITTLMRAAANGNTYNYEALYRAILPLANNVDKNQLFLAYLYHGSLYDYDKNWTLTVEKFINFLSDKVLPDGRFAERIDNEMREKIDDGHKTINEAKDLLVGPRHYRALVESNLPAEGDQTFALISDLKSELGPRNKIDYYMVGDSAMAYEMSQTFSDEMNFITILTMLAIFAVVVCTFKSFFVSMLLVLVIQCAVYIVMAYLSLTGSRIFFIALIIVQSILMGATIDYAILFTSYYVENRSYFKMSVRDALISTYNRSINAILTSSSILIIVTAIVGNLATAIAAAVCQAISLGTFCATLIILVLLPALLATLDKFVVKDSRNKVAKTDKGVRKLLAGFKSLL
ncbi:MAG: MMPL family transporter [Candidatus Saccharibacteria bacterium]|nr:MMPL family transporter [Candidatus Saccharibacteria bacterium]